MAKTTAITQASQTAASATVDLEKLGHDALTAVQDLLGLIVTTAGARIAETGEGDGIRAVAIRARELTRVAMSALCENTNGDLARELCDVVYGEEWKEANHG